MAGTTPCILKLGTRCRSVDSFMLRPLYLRGMSPPYPLDRMSYGTKSHSGLCGKEKNTLMVVSNLYSSTFNYFGRSSQIEL